MVAAKLRTYSSPYSDRGPHRLTGSLPEAETILLSVRFPIAIAGPLSVRLFAQRVVDRSTNVAESVTKLT